MLLNFAQFSITNLEWVMMPSSEVNKAVANAIFTYANKMDLIDIARAIKESESIEVSIEDVAELKALMGQDIGLLPFAKREFIAFIESCGSKAKEEKKAK